MPKKDTKKQMTCECRVYDMAILGMVPIMGVEIRKETNNEPT